MEWTYELLDEGLLFYFQNQIADEIDTQQSGWSSDSKTNLIPAVRLHPPTFAQPDPVVWPIRIIIEVGDGTQGLGIAYTSSTGNNSLFPSIFRLYEVGTGIQIPFIFNEVDSTENGKIDAGELIQLTFKKREDRNRLTPTWNIAFEPPVDANGLILPSF